MYEIVFVRPNSFLFVCSIKSKYRFVGGVENPEKFIRLMPYSSCHLFICFITEPTMYTTFSQAGPATNANLLDCRTIQSTQRLGSNKALVAYAGPHHCTAKHSSHQYPYCWVHDYVAYYIPETVVSHGSD